MATEHQQLERKAGEVAQLLKAMSNQKRLLLLCKLAELGEVNVTQLAEEVGLSQSALSQHLARLRDDQLVTFRRDAQTLFYRISDPRIEALLDTLYALFCAPSTSSKGAKS